MVDEPSAGGLGMPLGVLLPFLNVIEVTVLLSAISQRLVEFGARMIS